MTRVSLSTILAVAFTLLLGPSPAAAQISQVRGFVVDEAGSPLADVIVEMEYKGEGPKRTYSVKTNKKGGFVRVGMPAGSYKIVFSKEGYVRYGIDTELSAGGLSEICTNAPRPGEPCQEIVLRKAPAGARPPGSASAPSAPAGAAPPGAAPAPDAAAAAEAAKLGAAYTEAVAAIKLGQWDVAEAALKDVLAKLPDEPAVHFNLGHVYRQKRDFASAEAEFKRTIELEPAKSDAYVALAVLYEERGRGPDAVALLTKVAPSFENDAKFQLTLGATAMNAGRSQESEAAFSKALALDPANVEVHFHLASLALGRNAVAEAVAHLEAYIAGAPAGAPNVEVAKKLLEAVKASKR